MIVLVIAIAIVIAAVGLIRAADGHDSSKAAAATDTAALQPARAFLHDWVDPDGRVVRRDQGGDTVSEGQAYGMLLALAVDDRTTFTAIWTWTRTNLQRSDGSLAWMWRDGSVRDEEPAADADADAANALLRAGAAWHDESLTRDGARISTALLHSSTLSAAPGRLLGGGPWALPHDSTPAAVAPDYLVAGTADEFAAATDEPGWRQVANGTRAMQTALLAAHPLPPDWVSAPATAPASAVTPAGAPGTDQAPQYGVSAPRLFIRLAASCDAADRTLAARGSDQARAVDAGAIRNLDGGDIVSWRSPLTAVAAAAIDNARGAESASEHALDMATDQERTSPTYYGAAWVALGWVLLRTGELGSCASAVTS